MNMAYGRYGDGKKWWQFWKPAHTNITFADYETASSVPVESPSSWTFAPGVNVESPTSWEFSAKAQRQMGGGDVQRDPIADITAIMGAGGQLTSGIAQLVHGGKPQPVYPQTSSGQDQQQPGTAPMNTGLVLLGVGTLAFIGLGLAAAVASK